MIRYIRVLGAALGGFVGLAFATAGDGLFASTDYAGALLAAWVVAWVVLGLRGPAVHHRRPRHLADPAGRGAVDRRVRDRRHRSPDRPADGPAPGPAAGPLPAPWGTWLPLGMSLFLGLGMLGLTVAKRADLLVAAEAVGLIRRPPPEGATEPRPASRTSSSIPARSSTAGSPRWSSPASSSGRSSSRGSCSTSSSTSPTAPTPLRRNRGRRGLEILSRHAEGTGDAGRDRRGRRAR